MFKFSLLENENVLNIHRQSEAVLFKPVLIIFALIYFPWYFLLTYGLAADYPRLMVFYTILVFLYGAKSYLLWLLNVYLITDRRLIIVNYKSLFNKKVSESPLPRILNVSFSRKGFLQAVFSFGSVEVQTQGLSEPLVLKNVSQPSKIKDSLWEIHNKYSLIK